VVAQATLLHQELEKNINTTDLWGRFLDVYGTMKHQKNVV